VVEVPLDRWRQSVFEPARAAPEQLLRPARVDTPAGLASGFDVSSESAVEADRRDDELHEILERQLVVGAEVDRVRTVVPLRPSDDALGRASSTYRNSRDAEPVPQTSM